MIGYDKSDGIHCLVKTELYVSKTGKKNHKSNNCVIQSCSMLSIVGRTYKGTYGMLQKYHKEIRYFSSSSSDEDEMLSCDSITYMRNVSLFLTIHSFIEKMKIEYHTCA